MTCVLLLCRDSERPAVSRRRGRTGVHVVPRRERDTELRWGVFRYVAGEFPLTGKDRVGREEHTGGQLPERSQCGRAASKRGAESCDAATERRRAMLTPSERFSASPADGDAP